MKTRRGFTLVELLVVIAIIALLMGILMPALSRVRQLAFRLTCGTNLSGIGKAMLVYANDYEDELPKAGGRNTVWGPTAKWSVADRKAAFGLDAKGAGGKATISSCFYLLVKYAEVTPKLFVCKGDAGTTEFKLADQPSLPPNFELIDAWDFGDSTESFKHCSYTYHIPFGSTNTYALTTSNEPGMAVAGDRNPWLKSPAAEPAKWSDWKPDAGAAGGTGTSDQAKKGNAIAHQNDGQNVLFLDSHVEFARRAYCSLEDDNIYTISRYPNQPDPWGTMPQSTAGCVPAGRKDSLLVHDPGSWGGR